VEEGELFFLQTRTGKRAPWAALRIATALVTEGLLEPSEALARLEALPLDRLERVALAAGPNDLPVARATPASAGVASGALVLDARRAAVLAANTPVILVRTELSTDDLSGMAAATGLLTTFGGRTSHAAVVARQLGKVCLVGCAELSIQDAARTCLLGGHRLHEGDPLTLDADHGFVYAGIVPTVRERPEPELAVVQQWRRAAAAAASV
ncbi:MAG: PEP-utilizing enzyme, partial [Vicinamibacterales bacterium]